MKNLFVIAAIMLLCFVACKKEISETNSISNYEPKARMTVNTGVLAFGSKTEMLDTLKKLRSLSITQRKSWESGRSFMSMITAYDTIMAGENAIADHMETLPSDSFPAYENRHTPLVNTYPNVIIETNILNGTGTTIGKYYALNIYNNGLAHITNKDGLVIIGNKTYCFTKDKIKSMNSTSSTYFSNLVAATSSTTIGSISISVANVPISSFPIATGCSGLGNWWVKSGTATNGPSGNTNKFKTITYFNQEQSESADINNTQLVTNYRVDITCLVKRMSGLWYDGRKPKSAHVSWNLVGNSVSHYFTSGGTLTSESLLLTDSYTDFQAEYSSGHISFEIPFSTASLPDQVRFIITSGCEDPELQSTYSTITSKIEFEKNNNSYYVNCTVAKP